MFEGFREFVPVVKETWERGDETDACNGKASGMNGPRQGPDVYRDRYKTHTASGPGRPVTGIMLRNVLWGLNLERILIQHVFKPGIYNNAACYIPYLTARAGVGHRFYKYWVPGGTREGAIVRAI